jgi:hypothetical protein
METNIHFYKIKLLKEFAEHCKIVRDQLIDELIINATDPIVRKRRYRMLHHLSIYESQIIQKINDFETDDPADIALTIDYQIKLPIDLLNFTHRSA